MMPIRPTLLALMALSATAQTVTVSDHRPGDNLDGSALQAAQKANPDDVNNTENLLRYYAAGSNDIGWSNRFALLTWNIEHHPEALLLGRPDLYQNMPQAMRDQMKPLWVSQVHQHADDPRVLRNAAAGLEKVFATIRVGGNVQASNLLRQVKPAYPPLALQAGISGTVRFTALIGIDGTISTLQLVSGHPLLVAAATQAVQQWVYRPTLLNGNPVMVSTTLDVNFTLNQ